MDIVKPIINFGQLLPISLILKQDINQHYYDNTIMPIIKIIGQHNNIRFRNVKTYMFVLKDEIVIKFSPPHFHILCDHKYYDGKVISNICFQINNYIEKKELLEPIHRKIVNHSIYKTLFRSLGSKIISNGVFGKKKNTFIKTFGDPLKPSNVISYIQGLENKCIIYLRNNKEKTVEQGNNFNIYMIYPNQTLKDAITKDQIIKKSDFPEMLLKRDYVIANFYPHFHIPFFTEKMIFNNNGIVILDIIGSIIVLKTYILTPKTCSNTYDLYTISHE